MVEMLIGAISLAAVLVGLFFLRFWYESRDRFFLMFAIAFWLEGIHRFIVYQWAGTNESSPLHYLVRLLAYGLILIAIIDKNRRR